MRGDQRKSNGVRVDHEKKSDGVRVHNEKKSYKVRVHNEKKKMGGEFTIRKINGVRHHDRKANGVRIQH